MPGRGNEFPLTSGKTPADWRDSMMPDNPDLDLSIHAVCSFLAIAAQLLLECFPKISATAQRSPRPGLFVAPTSTAELPGACTPSSRS